MVRLAHTGLQVPDARVRVARCRPYYVSRWEYRALLMRGRQQIGQIRGPLPDVADPEAATCEPVVSFHPCGRVFTPEDLERFAAACRLDGHVLSPARVLMLLVDEHRLEQMVRGCAHRGGVMARFVDQEQAYYIPLRTWPRSAEERAAALAHLERASGVGGPWWIWDGQGWGLLSVPDPPSAVPGGA
ncbi:hypothetical protein ACWDWV_00110 [Streptosporangium sandarakinum]